MTSFWVKIWYKKNDRMVNVCNWILGTERFVSFGIMQLKDLAGDNYKSIFCQPSCNRSKQLNLKSGILKGIFMLLSVWKLLP